SACTSIRTASCSSRSRPPPAGSRGRSAPIGSGSARPRRRSPSWACGSSRARWGRGSRGRRRSGVCSSRSRSTFSSSGSGSRAAGLAALLLLGRVPVPGAPLPPLWLFHGTTLALGVLVALSATRLGSGPGVLGAALATAFAQWGWTWALRGPGEITPLLLQGAAVLLFTAWPFLAGARFRVDPFAWYGAALAAPAWFLSLRRLYLLRFGAGTIGLLPVALALVSLTAAVRAEPGGGGEHG